MTTDPKRMWLAAGLLAAVHQCEELLWSMDKWLDQRGTTTLPWLDRHIRRAPLAAKSFKPRVTTVAAQAVGLLTVATLASRLDKWSRVLTSALTLGFAGAFTGHLIVAWRTKSLAPGTITSIIPGLPGAALVFYYINHDSICSKHRDTQADSTRPPH